MSVYSKLMKARLELQSRTLTKSGHNKFAGYYYFELGDFLPAIQEIFAKHGLCGIVTYGSEIARLTIVDDEGGGSIEVTSPMSSAALKGCHEVQNLGAVQTYIRRYLWVTALEIVEHDALDSSKPLDTKEVKRVGGLTDIGKSIDPDAKKWLEDAADYVKGLVKAGKTDSALEYLAENGVADDESLYLQTFLDTPTKKALGMVFVKAA